MILYEYVPSKKQLHNTTHTHKYIFKNTLTICNQVTGQNPMQHTSKAKGKLVATQSNHTPIFRRSYWLVQVGSKKPSYYWGVEHIWDYLGDGQLLWVTEAVYRLEMTQHYHWSSLLFVQGRKVARLQLRSVVSTHSKQRKEHSNN